MSPVARSLPRIILFTSLAVLCSIGLHESVHYIQGSLDPYVEPASLEIVQDSSYPFLPEFRFTGLALRFRFTTTDSQILSFYHANRPLISLVHETQAYAFQAWFLISFVILYSTRTARRIRSQNQPNCCILA